MYGYGQKAKVSIPKKSLDTVVRAMHSGAYLTTVLVTGIDKYRQTLL